MNNKYFCWLLFFIGIFTQFFLLILGGNLAYKEATDFIIGIIEALFFIAYFPFFYGIYIGIKELIKKGLSLALLLGILCHVLWLLLNCIAFALSFLGMA